MIDVKGLNKAAVLAALFNASKQQGYGFLDTSGAVDISEDDAEDIIADIEAGIQAQRNKGGNIYEKALCFDYLRGRVLKVDISGDEFDEYLFDRDNGKGSAQRAIDELR